MTPTHVAWFVVLTFLRYEFSRHSQPEFPWQRIVAVLLNIAGITCGAWLLTKYFP